MALDAAPIQPINLDGKVKKKEGSRPLAMTSHSDIWRGEFVDPCQTRAIVIKLIRGTLKPEEVEKLQMKLFREARVWATLCHPNIVPLVGITTAIELETQPIPGLVTPYYETGDLRKYVSDEKRTLNLNDKMSLLYQVADALNYLHSRKPPVIHGDVKPENVLIDDGGHAVLADFGLAVLLGTSGFTTKNLHGTVRYIAPELLLVEGSGAVRPTCATDVWAFGIFATEIFSRRTPYGTDRDSSLIDIVATKRETLKLEDYPEIRRDLWSELKRCWKWIPEERVSMHPLKKFIGERRDAYAAKG